jgi:ABC-2 type transport system permease protein
MKKLITIAWKDLTLALRDRAAFILMFLAPLALTLGLGLVTGRLGGGNDDTGLRDVPVVVVDQDGGQLGTALVEMFYSADLGTLVKPVTLTDVLAARRLVEDDKAAAAIVVPPGFTASIIPKVGQSMPAAEEKKVEVYANPAQPVGAGVIKTIVEEFMARVEAGRVSGQVAVTQLVMAGLVKPGDATAIGQRMGQQAGASTVMAVTVKRSTATGAPAPQFDTMAMLAPGMALLFLMYTVSRGGANLLAERDGGTLARLLVSPTGMTQIVGGKVVGVYLTAVVQVAVLILISSLLFGLKWGDPAGVIALVLAVAAGATGWGMAIAAFARTPALVGSLGATAMLLFGVLGGSFGTNIPLPGFLQVVGKATPNAWGVQGFERLASGGALGDVLPNVLALCAMAVVMFGVAVALFRRNGFVK